MDEEKKEDEWLKSSLKNLPDLRDERSKEEILARLKADERLQVKPVKKRPSFKWLPLAAAIAVVFFMILLIPMIEKGEHKADEASMSTHREMYIATEEAELRDDAAGKFTNDWSHVFLQKTENERLLPIDMQFGEQIIPVTFILSTSGVEDRTALFEQYREKIDAHVLGFDGFLEDLTEFKAAPYFKVALPNGQFYLLPQESDEMDVEGALLAMANPTDESVESVIPSFVQYDVEVSEEAAIIRFLQPLDLNELDQEEVTLLIEGFMLTAEQFNLQVQFENIAQLDFEQYDLTEPLPKPIGANPIYYLYD